MTSSIPFYDWDQNWYRRKKKPWELYPSPDNPQVRVVTGKDGIEREFRWWADPCPERDNPSDTCPGYVIEHMGPAGAHTRILECPDHGYRWVRPEQSLYELSEDRRVRWNAASVPHMFQGYSFSTFPKKGRALSECMEYARAGKLTQSLLLQGAYGTGKTGLAISILRERIELRNERGLFVVAPALFEEIRASFGSPGREQTPLLSRVVNVPLLMLDDIGTERPTEWVQEQLYVIINTRIINFRTTVMTTNLSMPELAEHLGERTAERLKYYRLLHIGGDNLRDRGQGKKQETEDDTPF